jgi:hypothetical protein
MKSHNRYRLTVCLALLVACESQQEQSFKETNQKTSQKTEESFARSEERVEFKVDFGGGWYRFSMNKGGSIWLLDFSEESQWQVVPFASEGGPYNAATKPLNPEYCQKVDRFTADYVDLPARMAETLKDSLRRTHVLMTPKETGLVSLSENAESFDVVRKKAVSVAHERGWSGAMIYWENKPELTEVRSSLSLSEQAWTHRMQNVAAVQNDNESLMSGRWTEGAGVGVIAGQDVYCDIVGGRITAETHHRVMFKDLGERVQRLTWVIVDR